MVVGLVAQVGRGGATQRPLQGRSWGGLLCSSPPRDEMEKMQRKRLLRSKIPGTPFCLLPRAPAPWAPWEKAALCRGRAGCPCLPSLQEFALPGEFRQLQEAVAPPCSEYLMVWLWEAPVREIRAAHRSNRNKKLPLYRAINFLKDRLFIKGEKATQSFLNIFNVLNNWAVNCPRKDWSSLMQPELTQCNVFPFLFIFFSSSHWGSVCSLFFSCLLFCRSSEFVSCYSAVHLRQNLFLPHQFIFVVWNMQLGLLWSTCACMQLLTES